MDMIEIAKCGLELVKVSRSALLVYCQQFGHEFINNEGLYIRKLTAYILACNELNWFKVIKYEDGDESGNYRCYGIGELRIYYNNAKNFVYNIYKADTRLEFNATLGKLYREYCVRLGLSKTGKSWSFSLETISVSNKVLQNFKDIFPGQKDIPDDIIIKKISARVLAYNEIKWYKESTSDTRIYFIDRLRIFYNVKENTIYRLYESDKQMESNSVIRKVYYLFCDYFGVGRPDYLWIKRFNYDDKDGEQL